MTADTNPNHPNADADPLTLDVMFDVLADERARVVLLTLSERRPEYDSWGEMALGRSEFITRYAAESGVDTHDALMGMHHATLPKLEDAGFIRYNDDNTVAAVAPDAITTAVRVMAKVDFELALAGGRA